MQIEMDRDVRTVLEFMQTHLPTAKLVNVAETLPALARLLWLDYQQEPVEALRLEAEPILSVCDN